MTNKKKQLSGQLCFDICTDTSKYIAQSNEILAGKQHLKLNSAKLLRILIMQIKPDDEEFKTYRVSIPELSKMLNIDASNLYKRVDEITEDLLRNHVSIRDLSRNKFIKFPWMTACAYDRDTGFAARLNPELKPFLLGLKERYTQYQLENVLTMKSVYGIRIFELLMKDQIMKFLPREGTDITLTVQEIREACDCETKFKQISQFREKVLDISMREINRTTVYDVGYEPVKKGRTIVAIKFHINSKYHAADPSEPDRTRKKKQTARKSGTRPAEDSEQIRLTIE